MGRFRLTKNGFGEYFIQEEEFSYFSRDSQRIVYWKDIFNYKTFDEAKNKINELRAKEDYIIKKDQRIVIRVPRL